MGDQDRRDPCGSQTRAKRVLETYNDQHLGGDGVLKRKNHFTVIAIANKDLFESQPPKPDQQHSPPSKKQKTSSETNCGNKSPSTPPPPSSSGDSSVISSDGHPGSPSVRNKPPISPVLYPQDSVNSSKSPSTSGSSGERNGQRGEFDKFKAHLKPYLLGRLTDLSKKEVAVCKVGHEMVVSILSLKPTLGCTLDPELEMVSEKSSRGALLIEEGEKLVKEAQILLSAAMDKKY